ncbi:isochorismatase family protein [Couchioplanes azureus]|uniref:isochorismatase family protein n=1 Tax=Couchioplanes caeruleus TaxID=56438 RepID=UPI0016713918|nr:isochorismatase family protein [Couchioplanes caeruleus]GGQ43747.1 phenazine biosynthesis protein PhzD [Couchioplanes caeruleus subsp. azureus]
MGIPRITPYPMPAPAELPSNTAGWRLDPRRALLLVHDMQRFFVRPFPADQEPVVALIDNTARILSACRAQDVPVAYTAQPGRMTDEQRGLLKDFWGPGMTGEPGDREIVAELAPRPRDEVFTKWRYSAFHRSGLNELLRREGRDQLIVCGVYAHVGILMTASDALAHDVQAFVVADATADFSADHHRSALRYAAERCAMVVTSDDVLTMLASTSAAGHTDRRAERIGG